jgi:gamma-glutamylcyclotransferase (GGCT)/AIG2-like uncharacterized protein YtfP
MPEYLFSYGTLQPDLSPPEIVPLVRAFPCMGRAHVRGVLYDLGDYPGIVLGERGVKVWGQVFVLPEDPGVLRRLDEYEEVDLRNLACSQFIRTKCVSVLESGTEVETWIYAYNREPGSASVIPSGDYAQSRTSADL